MTSAPSTSVRSPRRLKTRRIMRRSSGSVSLMRSSPPVTPASAMNEPISMWSGPTSCVHPPSSARPVIVRTFEPMPRMSAPIFTSIRARSWTCGSHAALPITVVPGVLAVDVRLGLDAGGAEADLVLVAPLDRDADAAQHAQHRLDVADPRDVAHDDLLGREDRGGEDRQSAVLVPGGNDRATERHAAVD